MRDGMAGIDSKEVKPLPLNESDSPVKEASDESENGGLDMPGLKIVLGGRGLKKSGANEHHQIQRCQYAELTRACRAGGESWNLRCSFVKTNGFQFPPVRWNTAALMARP